MDIELDTKCCQCGSTSVLKGGTTPITWVCCQCNGYVCCHCCLVIPGSDPPEYYEQTLCSLACWEKAGRPEE